MPAIIDHLKDQKTITEQCICGRWRYAHWPEGEWTDAPPPPRHECTPRSCPDCTAAQVPCVSICQECGSWRWYMGEIWYPGPAPEDAIPSHGVCPGCLPKLEREWR